MCSAYLTNYPIEKLSIKLKEKTENNIINITLDFDTIKVNDWFFEKILFHINYDGPRIFGDNPINYAKPYKSVLVNNVSIDIDKLNNTFRSNGQLVHYCGENDCEGDCGVQRCGMCIDTCRCCEW
jgi:hypothetical protein